MNLAPPPAQARRSRRPDPDIARGGAPASIRSCVSGVGAALPARVVLNAELATKVDTSDEWIVQRSGIRQRHVAGAGVPNLDAGHAAAEPRCATADVAPRIDGPLHRRDLDPDQVLPAVACPVQAASGVSRGRRCPSTSRPRARLRLRGLHRRHAPPHRRAQTGAGDRRGDLLAGPRLERRGTCVLFGDGAGAMLLEARMTTGASPPGVHRLAPACRRRARSMLSVDEALDPRAVGDPSACAWTGRKSSACRSEVPDSSARLAAPGGTADRQHRLARAAPGQRRILDGNRQRLGSPATGIVTVDRHGNTSAASIPLALDVAAKDGRIKPGDLVMIEAMGGGFTWGAALIRW